MSASSVDVERSLVPVRAVVKFVVGAALVLVTACTGSDGAIAEFGEEPPEGAQLPADLGLDVADVEAPDAVPPEDATLFEGGWPEAAAFVAREAENGRPTLVNIFASWCGPCEREMPLLLEAAAANPDIAFLGIDHQDRREHGEEFVERLGIDFPTIFDFDGDVAMAVGARAMPTTVLFDADGQLVARAVGEVSETQLEEFLDEVR